MRSFQHSCLGNGNGMNRIKLCFSMKEEGRKEEEVWPGFHRIRKQFRLYEKIPFFFFLFFNSPRNLDDARILKMYEDTR